MASHQGKTSQLLEQIANLYVDTLNADADSHRTHAHVPRRRVAAANARVGDLWMTAGTTDAPPCPVLITWTSGNRNRAVAVIDEPLLAGSDDVIVMEEDSPLGVPLGLCGWRDIPVSEDDLDTLIGVIPDDVLEPLAMLLQNRVTGGFSVEMLEETQLSNGDAAVRWRIRSKLHSGSACEFFAGLPIVRANDPRLRVREVVAQLTQHLEQSALNELEAELPVPAATATTSLRSRIASLVSAISLPFPRPNLIALGGAPASFATADSAEVTLVAQYAPGEEVTIRFDRDGLGEALNTISSLARVAVVLTTSDGGQFVEMGVRGAPAGPMLILASNRSEQVWYERPGDSSKALQIAVFAESKDD